MAGPLLIDVGCASHDGVDGALEILHKSLSEPGGDGVWEPHHSPFVQLLIERFTAAGLHMIDAVQTELALWALGKRQEIGPLPSSPRLEGWRLRPEELDLARLYLAHLPIEQWRLPDYDLLVEYLVQRYLPAGVLHSEAEAYAVRSTLMGHVQAAHPELSLGQAAVIVPALPAKVGQAVGMFKLPGVAESVMEYGALHCAESIKAVSSSLRSSIKGIVLDHQAQVLAGEKPRRTLEAKLFDAAGAANRDWRRIALTEAVELSNQGFLASFKPGSRLRRLEAYTGACGFCRSIDQRIFRLTTADDPKKDGQKDVWPGKTNVGRSASPMKRGVLGLVERSPDELWWPAAGAQHPHCRGTWHAEPETPPGVSPQFSGWLESVMAQGRVKP